MGMMYKRTYLDAVSGLAWHDGEQSCYLRDDERYHGHAVKKRAWLAYAVMNANDDVVKYVGRFSTREEAKEALEELTGVRSKPLVMTAGAQTFQY